MHMVDNSNVYAYGLGDYSYGLWASPREGGTGHDASEVIVGKVL